MIVKHGSPIGLDPVALRANQGLLNGQWFPAEAAGSLPKTCTVAPHHDELWIFDHGVPPQNLECHHDPQHSFWGESSSRRVACTAHG